MQAAEAAFLAVSLSLRWRIAASGPLRLLFHSLAGWRILSEHCVISVRRRTDSFSRSDSLFPSCSFLNTDASSGRIPTSRGSRLVAPAVGGREAVQPSSSLGSIHASTLFGLCNLAERRETRETRIASTAPPILHARFTESYLTKSLANSAGLTFRRSTAPWHVTPLFLLTAGNGTLTARNTAQRSNFFLSFFPSSLSGD